MLIDAHCHLDESHFPEGPQPVLDRGREVGVGHFVVIGVGATLDGARLAARVASENDDVSATVGMHPHDAARLSEPMFAEIERLADEKDVVAIGEVGLDYHYMQSPKDAQGEVFRRMIDLGKRKRLPIVIHTRTAAEETLSILEEEGADEVGGIIHCFSEDRAFARRALDLDFDVSFSGIVTFKSAKSIQDVARWAPADRIMVETDSPYLAPVPLRGKRNEPANVVHTARYVAELRGESFAALCHQTSQTVTKRLRLPVELTAPLPQEDP